MIAATLIWFFLIQMPGDEMWTPAGHFHDEGTCKEMRLLFLSAYQNFVAQPCQREWRES